MKYRKSYLQKTGYFIGSSLIVISIPFIVLEEPSWCFDVGYILFMGGLCLILITFNHRYIFGSRDDVEKWNDVFGITKYEWIDRDNIDEKLQETETNNEEKK